MKKTLVTLVVLAIVGGSVYAYLHYRKAAPKATVATAQVTRGDVIDTVGATGTLQAVTTVQVGTQVSGTIQSLYADFNSLVKKGQVLARLDPSLFQTQIEQAKANLLRSQADVERLRVSLEDANTKLKRAQELNARQLIPKTDLETAQVNARSIEAQIRSSEAQVTQAQASLNQNEVNLQHTVIEAPIDGLVISRNVDVGQTVAASMQAPTLFVLAADLTKMQVVANLDESDVGRIRPKQIVTFRVDAYPADTFRGTVSQVRLNPIVQQNVVTYATVIDVPNNELKLKPGMTANVNVEIARANNVLRVPNAALRFRPTPEMFTALGLTPPDAAQLREMTGGGRGRSGRGGPGGGANSGGVNGPGASSGGAATAANGEGAITGPGPRGSAIPTSPAAGPSSAPAPGAAGTNRPNPSGGSTAAGGRGAATAPSAASGEGGAPANGDDRGARGGDRYAQRQNMTPEEREARLQRMRERGFDPSASSGGAGNAGGRGGTSGGGSNAPGGRGNYAGNAGAGGRSPGGRGGDPAATANGAGGGRSRANASGGDARGAGANSGLDAARTGGATTIDALFGPLARVESFGRAWLFGADKQLKPVRLRLGISDGQNTELVEGDLNEGTEVVTNISTGNETRPNATQGFPFGQPGRGGFPGGGGFGPGGGGNRGGGGGGRGGR